MWCYQPTTDNTLSSISESQPTNFETDGRRLSLEFMDTDAEHTACALEASKSAETGLGLTNEEVSSLQLNSEHRFWHLLTFVYDSTVWQLSRGQFVITLSIGVLELDIYFSDSNPVCLWFVFRGRSNDWFVFRGWSNDWMYERTYWMESEVGNVPSDQLCENGAERGDPGNFSWGLFVTSSVIVWVAR